MNSWIKLYDDLMRNHLPEINSFLVNDIPGYDRHKVGIDSNGWLCILVSTRDVGTELIPSFRYQYFEMLFGINCHYVSASKEMYRMEPDETFTILILKSGQRDLQVYFLSICQEILGALGDFPSASAVSVEVSKVISIFQNLSLTPFRTLEGLFGELVLINEATDPEYFIRAWHINSNDLFDFNNGYEFIEVKSTLSRYRKHRFSQDQLQRNYNRPVFLVSILLAKVDIGLTVFDVLHKIKERVTDKKLVHKLDKIFFSIAGRGAVDDEAVRFDYSLSVETMKVYNIVDIPRISSTAISSEITDIKYTVNLENIKSSITGGEMFVSFIKIGNGH